MRDTDNKHSHHRDPGHGGHEDETPDVSHISNPDVAHEESDVNVRYIFYFIVGLAALGVITHLLLAGMLAFFNTREQEAEPPPSSLIREDQPNRPPEEIFPEPRLEVVPMQNLADYLRQEEAALGSYGWVDQNAGVVRIPIEEAKKRVLERGLPTAGGAAQGAQPQQGGGRTSYGESSSGQSPEKRQ